MEKVFWLENEAIQELHLNEKKNQLRYMEGSFGDYFDEKKNSLRDVGVRIDVEKIKGLQGNSGSEISDACILFSAIVGMTPSLASRGNIWVHLSHTLLLQFGRKRWLNTEKDISPHFLSVTPGRLRDDHVSSRPWWSAYIASRISGNNDPGDIQAVLDVFARTTDTRSASFERPSVFGDIHLARLIYKHLQTTPELKDEKKYREFMKNINFRSNGFKFSEMSYQTFAQSFVN